MAKIVSFQPAITKQPKVRYMITIDEDETSAYAARELKPGHQRKRNCFVRRVPQ